MEQPDSSRTVRAAVTPDSPVALVPELVRQLYAIVAKLEGHFPGRRFTPDGHLVGSIGEVIAAHRYTLRLLPGSAEAHDAVAENGLRVQIKATQVSTVAMRSACDHLLVLHLLPNGDCKEVYNGPGALAWQAAGRLQTNGQRPISFSRLRRLMETVPEQERLPVAAF